MMQQQSNTEFSNSSTYNADERVAIEAFQHLMQDTTISLESQPTADNNSAHIPNNTNKVVQIRILSRLKSPQSSKGTGKFEWFEATAYLQSVRLLQLEQLIVIYHFFAS
jgi:hypothetical protein